MRTLRLVRIFSGVLGDFLRALGTLATALALEDLLLSKAVTLADSTAQGVVTDIKMELPDKIWAVIDNSGRERLVPVEQIVAVGYHKAVVISLMPAGFEGMGTEARKEGLWQASGRVS